jgi:hypothetical protein
MRKAFAGFAGPIGIEALDAREWASITFSGQRHALRARLEGAGAREAMARFREGLEDREFDLGDHILIGIAVIDARHTADTAEVELEALTVAAD